MTASREHTATPRKRRPAVDVYFVLYLTALVLLLGTVPLTTDADRDELEEAIVRLIDLDFHIEAEKIGLFIPIRHASMTSIGQNLRNDSINEVSAHGSFRSVDFRILDVTDTISGRALPPSPGMLIRSSDSTARFVWNAPPSEDPAVFFVRIEGRAVPRIPESVQDSDMRKRIEEILEDRAILRDTVRFLVNVISLEEIVAAMQAPAAPTLDDSGDAGSPDLMLRLQELLAQGSSGTSGSFSALAARPFVLPSSQGSWTQEVMIVGTDVSSVRVVSPSDVHISGRSQRGVTISGDWSVGSNRQVDLILADGDNQQVAIDFEIRAVRSSPAPPPTLFYDDNVYSIDLTIPEISSSLLSVDIIENSAMQQQGKRPTFEYRPSGPGNGEFVLYVEGNEYQRFPFEINQVPRAGGRVVVNNRDSVVLEVTTHGRINGRQNVGVVKIWKGQEVRDPRILSQQFDKGTLCVVQRWVIDRSGDAEAPFEVAIYDQRGMDFYRQILRISAP